MEDERDDKLPEQLFELALPRPWLGLRHEDGD